MTMINHFFRLALVAGPTLVTGAALYIGTKLPENGPLLSGTKIQDSPVHDSSVKKVTSSFNKFKGSEFLFLTASFFIFTATFFISREIIKMTSYKDSQVAQVMPLVLALIAGLGVFLVGLSSAPKTHPAGG